MSSIHSVVLGRDIQTNTVITICSIVERKVGVYKEIVEGEVLSHMEKNTFGKK